MFSLPQITEALVTQAVFIAAMAMMAFIYAGYPALIFAISLMFKRPVRRDDITPRVSVIIAAYNEERDIAAKLKNTLARSEEHTSELQSLRHLVCRLLLE